MGSLQKKWPKITLATGVISPYFYEIILGRTDLSKNDTKMHIKKKNAYPKCISKMGPHVTPCITNWFLGSFTSVEDPGNFTPQNGWLDMGVEPKIGGNRFLPSKMEGENNGKTYEQMG